MGHHVAEMERGARGILLLSKQLQADEVAGVCEAGLISQVGPRVLDGFFGLGEISCGCAVPDEIEVALRQRLLELGVGQVVRDPGFLTLDDSLELFRGLTVLAEARAGPIEKIGCEAPVRGLSGRTFLQTAQGSLNEGRPFLRELAEGRGKELGTRAGLDCRIAEQVEVPLEELQAEAGLAFLFVPADESVDVTDRATSVDTERSLNKLPVCNEGPAQLPFRVKAMREHKKGLFGSGPGRGSRVNKVAES